MAPHILIPVRPFAEGKSRLAAVLGDGERAALNRRFFDHVFGLACRVATPAHCAVISHAPQIRNLAERAGARAIVEAATGLNDALTQAAAVMPADAPLLVLSTDLPWLSEADIAAMIMAGTRAEIAIAPDQERSGTNALLLGRAGLIPFLYGPGSLAAHEAAAVSAGLSIVRVERPGLAMDIDTSDQLAALSDRDRA